MPTKFIIASALAHLSVGFLVSMPGKRSYHIADMPTESQLRRKARDEWYRTSHSAANKSFVEVSTDIVPEIKAMARAKELHVLRESQTGTRSPHGRIASRVAAKEGIINEEQRKNDVSKYSS